jgi:hypothetical protein
MDGDPQINLESELHRLAQAKADELHISLAEYVRRLVAIDLEQTNVKPTSRRSSTLPISAPKLTSPVTRTTSSLIQP